MSLVARMIPVTAMQHVAKRRDWGSGFLLGIVLPPHTARCVKRNQIQCQLQALTAGGVLVLPRS